MRRSLFGVLLAVFAVLVMPGAAQAAPPAPFCRPDQRPTFLFGFAALKAQLGATMGEPIECEHPNSANGDTLQATTTGLAFYRQATNTPTSTDGHRHWALTPDGLVYWEGDAVDPPATATAVTPAPQARPAPVRTRVAAADYLPTEREMPPGFVASGADQVTLIDDGELVSRIYRRRDGSTIGVIAARTPSPDGAAAACGGLLEAATERGFEAVAESQRGDGGVVLIGRSDDQPSTVVLFTLGVVCGGAAMTGPIIAAGTSDANAPEQFGHVLTVLERKARAWPDGYR